MLGGVDVEAFDGRSHGALPFGGPSVDGLRLCGGYRSGTYLARFSAVRAHCVRDLRRCLWAMLASTQWIFA
jgi:hypothetical protein